MRSAEWHHITTKNGRAPPRRCACARAVASSSGETPAHWVPFSAHSKPIIDQRSAADACATEDRIHVNGEMRTQGASESWRVGAWSVRTRSSAPNCDAQRCTSHCTSSARDRPFSWVEAGKADRQTVSTGPAPATPTTSHTGPLRQTYTAHARRTHSAWHARLTIGRLVGSTQVHVPVGSGLRGSHHPCAHARKTCGCADPGGSRAACTIASADGLARG